MSLDCRIKIRVSSEEKAAISEAAKLQDSTVSEIIRRGIESAISGKPYRSPAENADRQKFLLELARIGSNINQIARHLNSGDDINTLAALCRIQTMLDEIRKSECSPNS